MCSGACISTANELCICHKGTERWLHFYQYNFFFSLIFDVLLFRIPTKSIVHFFFSVLVALLPVCHLEWKRISYEEKLWKIIFRLKSVFASFSSPCSFALSLYLFVISIEKWAHWKWAHAMLNQHVFDFSVMIFVIIWNSVNSK